MIFTSGDFYKDTDPRWYEAEPAGDIFVTWDGIGLECATDYFTTREAAIAFIQQLKENPDVVEIYAGIEECPNYEREWKLKLQLDENDNWVYVQNDL